MFFLDYRYWRLDLKSSKFLINTRLTNQVYVIFSYAMASVAKWLRQRFVVPPFVGSIPIVRPEFLPKILGIKPRPLAQRRTAF